MRKKNGLSKNGTSGRGQRIIQRKLIGIASIAGERKNGGKKERGDEAVKKYPHTCVFVEGTETKA